ncbi:nuclease-related domain-containing protein [Streptomyces uncialis]|uniref:nuclease-related domain-containing protein n=1 Tax=Streptomyces uncialis TaxID=1048205 RepID=UPI00364F2038
MTDLRVVPTHRQGHQLLHVTTASGRTLAWYDREDSRVTLLSTRDTDDVLAALAPYLTGRVTVGPPVLPGPADLARLSLHPDDDLAPNRPGENLRVALDRDPSPPRRLRADPRRTALAAEEATGAALDALEAGGWRILHSVPLPGGDRVPHLAIGPAGLFAVHALPARRRQVHVDDPLVTVGRSAAHPLLRTVRALADRASHALAAEVRAVLALAGAARVTVTAAPRDIRVLRDTELSALAREDAVLKPADVESLHATARDRATWHRL